MEVALFGVVIGALLFIAKYCAFWLLTSVKNETTGKMEQRMWPKWILFGEILPLRDRIHDSTFLLFCVDTISGYAGMHVLGAMGGGVIATVGIATYTIVCMFVLMKQFLFNWFKDKIAIPGKRKKHRYVWQE